MKKIFCLLAIMAQLAGCAISKQNALLFRPPQDYASYLNVSGVMIGCEAFGDDKRTEQVFGFEPRKAGILPVQFALDNKSGQAVEVESNYLVLIDGANSRWKTLSNQEAVERVEKNILAGAPNKKNTHSTASGVVIGLAAEVIPESRAEEIRSGGGSGVAFGADKEKSEPDNEREARILSGMRMKGIEDRKIPSGSLVHGFIYFPAEMEAARELRFRIRFAGTGKAETISLRLR